MAGVSFYCDGVPLDAPLLSSCSGPRLRSDFANTEAELRRLFDRISATLAGESSPGIPAFESLCSDCVERWVQRFLGESGAGSTCCRRFSLFPDPRRRIEALAHELLSERMASSGSSGSRKRKRGFVGMLMHLKGCAVDPFHVTPGGGHRGNEWIQMLLRFRHVVFLNRDRPAAEDPPESESDEESRARKKQKGMPIQPRRSLRIAEKLKIDKHRLATFRTRIGLGSSFQADVLEWTGPPDVSEEHLDDSRLLGTKVWPVEGDDGSSEVMVGRGRPESCACTSPGSIACVKSHVSAARLQLRSDLGQAFFSWGFDGMGEDVSKLWTRKERKKFAPLEGVKSGSRYKTFWQLAESCFPSKSRLHLLNYYFNVFIPRRMSQQSRLPSAKVSSDNDFEEDDDDDKKDEKLDDDDDDKKGKSPKRPDDDDDKKGKSPKRTHDDDKKGKSPKRAHDDDKEGKSPKRAHDGDKKGKSPKGQSSESKSAKGQSPQSKSAKSQSSESKSAKGQSPQSKSAKGQSPQSKSAKGQSPKGKSVGSSGSKASPRSQKSRKKT